MENNKLKDKIFPLRLDTEMHRQLRKASYLTEMPMAEIIRLGIKMKLEETKKILTNADIAV